LLVVALFALALRDDSFIGFWDDWSPMHDIDELARSIRASGNWGVAVPIGLMVMHSFIPFPAEVIALANGIIYGTTFGTLITWTGAMLGAQAAFWTARSFGEPIVERLVRADRRTHVDRWIAKNGTAALLTMRLIPVIAFNLINYAAGLANVRRWTFTWTTALGILPLAFLMVAAGDQLKNIPLRLVNRPFRFSLSCLLQAFRAGSRTFPTEESNMKSEEKLRLSLLLLRLGVFIVMLMWTLDKLVNPDHAIGIYKQFYFLGGIAIWVMYALGAVEMLIILGFVAGFMKRWTYGIVLLLHAVSTFSSFGRYLDPWKNLLFFAAWPMLAACITLYLLRDEDTLFAVETKRPAA
jgi:uncharacterized membrane protein YdjX (TVP38/TMEM64 family)